MKEDKIMNPVYSALNDLTCAFEEFKSANNDRISSLEKHEQKDGLIERKMNELNEKMDHAYEKLNKFHLSFNRPILGNLDETFPFETHEHKSAFLSYIRKGDESKLCQLETKSLNTINDPEGGYLIPQSISMRINKDLTSISPIRELANVLTISSSAVEILIDQNSAEVGWVAETQERPVTRAPQLQKLKIPVHEIYAKPQVTQKLIDDSRVNIEEWLSNRIANKMAQIENNAFVNGDGQNKPKGFLNYASAVRANLQPGQIEHLITGQNGALAENNSEDIFIDTINSMKAEYQKGAVWLMSRSAHAAIRKLKDQNGLFLWQPGLAHDPCPLLLGYKVVIVDDIPPLVAGTASTSIVFANLKEGYQIVDREGIHVLRDPFSVKPYIEFYTTKRVGGDVVNSEAFKFIRFAA